MIARRPSGFIAPCLPSKVVQPPSGPDWLHEIKPDGYRLMVRRDGERVRCLTRNGHDWTDRFPAIVDAALRIVSKQTDGRYRRGIAVQTTGSVAIYINGWQLEGAIARDDGRRTSMRCAASAGDTRRCCTPSI